jgi:small nuclear ribonucleoprotein (snRNP)-like protein
LNRTGTPPDIFLPYLKVPAWCLLLPCTGGRLVNPVAYGQTLIIFHPKLGQMVNGIVLPIKKVFALVDAKISVEIKDEGRKLQGRLVAVDEYLNIHMEETIEFVDNQRGRSLGTVVIRGNNILTIAPVI